MILVFICSYVLRMFALLFNHCSTFLDNSWHHMFHKLCIIVESFSAIVDHFENQLWATHYNLGQQGAKAPSSLNSSLFPSSPPASVLSFQMDAGDDEVDMLDIFAEPMSVHAPPLPEVWFPTDAELGIRSSVFTGPDFLDLFAEDVRYYTILIFIRLYYRPLKDTYDIHIHACVFIANTHIHIYMYIYCIV